jgi:hypothetical protein
MISSNGPLAAAAVARLMADGDAKPRRHRGRR